MNGFRKFFGLFAPLAGLEEILDQVAKGQLSTSNAAEQIRKLASRPHIPPWLPRLFRIIGVMFAIGGFGVGCYSVAFGIGAKEAKGTVTDFIGGSPIVEFEVGGQTFSFQSSISSSPPAYFVGEKVDVLYRPNNPRSAQINSFTDRWLFPLAFTAAGIWAVICSYLFPRWISFFTGTSDQSGQR